MRFRVTGLLVFALLLTGAASAQSLGAAARRERERREKNKKQGVAVREYSETDIFGEEEDEGEETEAEVFGEASADDVSESSSPLGSRIDIDLASEEANSHDAESRDRKVQEAEWRTRFQEARQRVALAREQKRILDGVHHVEGMKLVDDNGNVIVETLDQLRALVAEASRELIDAEKAAADLEEQARRAGVPPGWRR
jgi:hypothetical protein